MVYDTYKNLAITLNRTKLLFIITSDLSQLLLIDDLYPCEVKWTGMVCRQTPKLEHLKSITFCFYVI